MWTEMIVERNQRTVNGGMRKLWRKEKHLGVSKREAYGMSITERFRGCQGGIQER